MSIFNQITFFVLVAEIAVFLLSLIPLNFIPVRSRKAFMQWSGKALANDTVVWLARIVLLLVGGVFVDTIIRLQKLDSALHDRHEHSHSSIESTIEDLQYKTKLFYSQRNMYLSLTSLFLVVVIYRRIKDIYLVLQLQEEAESKSVTIKSLKAQVETMINATIKPKDSTEKPASKPSSEEVNDIPKASDAESSGLRKRK
ncbi:hypothetical protein HDU67_001134 [Dinochytrium kinnereticum]|nr:hypothetical protein HDU67_001134 [Dinochytrium kinnereticum]